MNNKIKLNLVDGKRVLILKSFYNTYLIEFIKTRKQMEIHKRYLKTIYVEPNKKKIVKINVKSSQEKLDL